MTTLQITSIRSLDGDCCERYEGIAYDGCVFYLTLPKCCEIHTFDQCFCRKECIKTCHAYTSLCYDFYLKCFWALSYHDANRIYKLDCSLREVDYLVVKSCAKAPATLTGIACSCSNELLISYDGGIAKIAKTQNPTPTVLKKAACGTQYTAVEKMDGGYLYSSLKTQGQAITFCRQNGDTVLQCCLPEEYMIQDMTTIFASGGTTYSGTFYMLAAKRSSYSYLLKCTLVCMDNKISPCLPQLPDTPSCTQSAGNIIESIALVETALSHILNAEGEKIQKIVSCAQSPCEIMAVNEAVNKTITNITHLEQVLYSKLQLAKDICPPCGED